ncbi:hypothetical protein [Streptomyces fagopyri]|uniref:hypothetical protein n=1 Tax=Streptomyces fagopyri TaxID=2662397 RepID=UPI00340EC991
MRHIITTAAAAACAAAVLALTGCSSSDTSKPAKPTPAASSSAPAQVKWSVAEQIEACSAAIAAGQDQGDGASSCTGLSADDYMKALHDANEQGQSGLQDLIDEASKSAHP